MHNTDSSCSTTGSMTTMSGATSSSVSLSSSEEGTTTTDPDIRNRPDTPFLQSPTIEEAADEDERHEIDVSGYEREEEELAEDTEQESSGPPRTASTQFLSPLDDCELSFLQRSRPVCRKTKLVSCLSSGSTSPGPMSPLLSDEDFGLSTPPSSIASTSRRCSNESAADKSQIASMGSQTPKVRFKRGCVITEVNLTWAASSYDRAPIDVAESLDIKRCHSFDGSECLPSPIVEFPPEGLPSHCQEPVSVYAAPPSPPLPSSPCTAAHANYAYATTFGEHSEHQGESASQLSPQRNGRSNSESSVSSSSEAPSLPLLMTDEGSCSSASGSDSDEYLNNLIASASLKLGQTPTLASYFDSRRPAMSSAVSDSGNHSMDGSITSSSENEHESEEERCMFDDGEQNLKTPTANRTDSPSLHWSTTVTPDEPNMVMSKVPVQCTTQARRSRRRRQQEEDLYAACDALGGF